MCLVVHLHYNVDVELKCRGMMKSKLAKEVKKVKSC